MSVLSVFCIQASRFPCREKDGYWTSLPVAASHWAAPPVTGILSRRLFPAYLVEKMISRPSGPQARFETPAPSKVSRFASPPLTDTR